MAGAVRSRSSRRGYSDRDDVKTRECDGTTGSSCRQGGISGYYARSRWLIQYCLGGEDGQQVEAGALWLATRLGCWVFGWCRPRDRFCPGRWLRRGMDLGVCCMVAADTVCLGFSDWFSFSFLLFFKKRKKLQQWLGDMVVLAWVFGCLQRG